MAARQLPWQNEKRRPERVASLLLLMPVTQARLRQDPDGVDVDDGACGMHELEGVRAVCESGAGPGLLPVERCVVLVECTLIDVIHEDSHLAAVEVPSVGQLELCP